MQIRSIIKRARDHIQLAPSFLGKATQETPAEEQTEEPKAPEATEGKNPAAVALGRLGGKKGGKARTAIWTPEERKAMLKKLHMPGGIALTLDLECPFF